jgi:hypothetical protein
MKILGRTLAIFCAAMIVVGITFAVVGSSASATPSPAIAEQGASQVQSSAASDSAAQSRHPEYRGPAHEGDRAPNLFGVIEVVQNLVIVGVIIAIVSGITHVWGRRHQVGRAA